MTILEPPTLPSLVPNLKCFTNCHLCISGEAIPQDLYFSPDTGLITPNYYYRVDGVERIDLGGAIVAPGYLDLQTNGMAGVHFTGLAVCAEGTEEGNQDESMLREVASVEVQHGVTGWWATVPTVHRERWKEVGNPGSTSKLMKPIVYADHFSRSSRYLLLGHLRTDQTCSALTAKGRIYTLLRREHTTMTSFKSRLTHPLPIYMERTI